jgi:DNA-binding CsgD family transcriptional regulator
LQFVSADHLFERDQARQAIARLLAESRSGRGGALFVVGEAGLGKTSLVEEACRTAAAAPMDVAFGRGEVMEGALAFGLLHQVVASLPEPIAGLNTESLAAASPTAPMYHLMRWLEKRAARPLLLALDDLQWSDRDSLALFMFLAGRLTDRPVVLLGTMRPWPADAADLARDLVAAGRATIERLAPLSREAATQLLVERSGVAVDTEAATRAWELCAGNPLLTEQLAATVEQGEVVPAIGDRVVPHGQLLLARFAGLDGDRLRGARAASVLGTAFRPDVAAEVAGLDPARAPAAFDALFRSRLVVEDESGDLRFVHPLLAQALYDDIAPAARRELHTLAFRALERRGLDGEACEHAIRADLVGDPVAADVLERAGRAASAAGAVATAVRRLEGAVCARGDRASTELRLALARARVASGRMEEAIESCRALLADDELSWTARVEVLQLLGRTLVLAGAPDLGQGALEEAVEIAAAHDPVRAVQPTLDLALSTWRAHGPGRAGPLTRRAQALARAASRPQRERTDAVAAYIALTGGDASELAAIEPFAVFLDPAPTALRPDPNELNWPWAPIYLLAMSSTYTEQLGRAEHAFRLARDEVDRIGATNALAILSVQLVNVLLRRGRVADALDEATRAEQLAELVPGVGAYPQLARAEALVWAGRFDESDECRREAERRGSGDWFVQLWAAHVQGARLLWLGDPGASDVLARAEEITRAVGIGEPCHVHWAAHAVAAHVAANRDDDVRRLVEWLEERSTVLPCRWPRIVVALAHAALAARRGDDDEADAQYRTALVLHAEVELPLHRVEALVAYGRYLRSRRRAVEARPHLADALATAEAAGAAWLAETARTELALAGGRRRRSARSSELTPAEERVAALAAAGHSNTEIARQLHVAVSTVETHLKRTYAKLDISSRRELMRGRSG